MPATDMKEFAKDRPYLVIAIMAVGACLFFYLGANYSGATGQGEIWSWSLGTTSATSMANSEVPAAEPTDLGSVLNKASMDNKTVILTTLSEAWTAPNSIIDLFLESFRIGEQTQPLLKHLVIVALDQKALDRCKSIHPHCFLFAVNGLNFTEEKRFMTPDYLTVVWQKISLMQMVVEMGYSFVFTDGDIMWLRNPFHHFSPTDDIALSCDGYNGNPYDVNNYVNTGFMYVKSSAKTIEFYQYWNWSRGQHPGLHDQAVFDVIKRSELVKFLGLKIRFLDTAFFGGFCQPSRDLNKVCTMHANCCVGLERKVHDLRIVLDDWKNFTMLPPEKKSGEVHWRVPIPDQCKV